MKKVSLRHAEYMATLPPYRFAAGDVVEIDDEWADQLIRRGIASPARANAKTVQQIRIDTRPPVPTAADERDARRAALEAELAALDEQDETAGTGHYSDMITREDVGGVYNSPPVSFGVAEPSGGAVRPTRRGGRRSAAAVAEQPDDGDQAESIEDDK